MRKAGIVWKEHIILKKRTAAESAIGTGTTTTVNRAIVRSRYISMLRTHSLMMYADFSRQE